MVSGSLLNGRAERSIEPSITATPTAAGTYTYTVTSYDAGASCTFITNQVIEVNNYPVISTVSATPSTVCAGSNVNLVATSLGIASGTGTIGTTGVSTSSNPMPFNRTDEGSRRQYLILASELTTAGFVSGDTLRFRLMLLL